MLESLKEEAYEANLLLPKFSLIDLTFGNVSCIDRDKGLIAIKPSGVDYTTLKPSDLPLIDLNHQKVEGDFKPSSDTATHVRLYNAFPNIRAVVHTHSRYATSFAQAGKPIPCYGTTHCDYFYGEVPVTRPMTPEEIQGAYELETGNVIVERFEKGGLSPDEVSAVLVYSHGPFVWGSSGAKAVENAFALEICAQMALQTQALNPQVSPVQSELLDKHFKRKHGATAYYGQG